MSSHAEGSEASSSKSAEDCSPPTVIIRSLGAVPAHCSAERSLIVGLCQSSLWGRLEPPLARNTLAAQLFSLGLLRHMLARSMLKLLAVPVHMIALCWTVLTDFKGQCEAGQTSSMEVHSSLLISCCDATSYVPGKYRRNTRTSRQTNEN